MYSVQQFLIRKHIRNIENTEKKFIKCQLAILFNNICLNEYIYIYIDKRALCSCAPMHTDFIFILCTHNALS